jgi:murein DD-endopeptidase MepM/ murein hydrolase activator NlpD
MAFRKVKYFYNTHTLSYEKVKLSWGITLFRVFGFLCAAAVFSAVIMYFAYTYFDSPKEKILKRELAQMKVQYKSLNNRMKSIDKVLTDLQDRDDNIYRVIFEAEPIPKDVREAGFGGSNLYSRLEGYDNSELMVSTTQTLDKLSREMYVQSKSYDEIKKRIENKAQMLQSIPAIQPVSNKNLMRIASGFGYRIDPIYKIMNFHSGLDFTAPTGTPIYATGDGVVSLSRYDNSGYGMHVVINHGYGYQTLYGHMSRMKVNAGQTVKRGDVIGYVGSTGKSTGPHCHYEVIKGGNKIDPVNFFYNDLSPAEYEKMLQQASKSNQAFD